MRDPQLSIHIPASTTPSASVASLAFAKPGVKLIAYYNDRDSPHSPRRPTVVDLPGDDTSSSTFSSPQPLTPILESQTSSPKIKEIPLGQDALIPQGKQQGMIPSISIAMINGEGEEQTVQHIVATTTTTTADTKNSSSSSVALDTAGNKSNIIGAQLSESQSSARRPSQWTSPVYRLKIENDNLEIEPTRRNYVIQIGAPAPSNPAAAKNDDVPASQPSSPATSILSSSPVQQQSHPLSITTDRHVKFVPKKDCFHHSNEEDIQGSHGSVKEEGANGKETSPTDPDTEHKMSPRTRRKHSLLDRLFHLHSKKDDHHHTHGHNNGHREHNSHHSSSHLSKKSHEKEEDTDASHALPDHELQHTTTNGSEKHESFFHKLFHMHDHPTSKSTEENHDSSRPETASSNATTATTVTNNSNVNGNGNNGAMKRSHSLHLPGFKYANSHSELDKKMNSVELKKSDDMHHDNRGLNHAPHHAHHHHHHHGAHRHHPHPQSSQHNYGNIAAAIPHPHDRTATTHHQDSNGSREEHIGGSSSIFHRLFHPKHHSTHQINHTDSTSNSNTNEHGSSTMAKVSSEDIDHLINATSVTEGTAATAATPPSPPSPSPPTTGAMSTDRIHIGEHGRIHSRDSFSEHHSKEHINPTTTKTGQLGSLFFKFGEGEHPGSGTHMRHFITITHSRVRSSTMGATTGSSNNDRDRVARISDGGPEDLEHHASHDDNAAKPSVDTYQGTISEFLGRGANAEVRLAHVKLVNPLTGEHQEGSGCVKLFAIKTFRQKNRFESARDYTKKVISEFCISSSLHHENIVETVDLIKDEHDHWCEVMEFMPGGDLLTRIKEGLVTEPEEINCYFKQLMNGVHYLHTMGVAHRDLKPENLLLDAKARILKITDFGTSEVFRTVWEKQPRKIKGLAGSEPYIPPEEWIENHEYEAVKVDIWACGVVYYCMSFRTLPWQNTKKSCPHYQYYLKTRKTPNFPLDRLPHAVRSLVYRMLDPDPDQRVTSEDVLQDTWFKSIESCREGESEDEIQHHNHHHSLPNKQK